MGLGGAPQFLSDLSLHSKTAAKQMIRGNNEQWGLTGPVTSSFNVLAPQRGFPGLTTLWVWKFSFPFLVTLGKHSF